jgi:hypothetical protein
LRLWWQENLPGQALFHSNRPNEQSRNGRVVPLRQPELTMTTAKKPKTKPGRASKPKPKRRNAALLAGDGAVRKSKPTGLSSTSAQTAGHSFNPASAMFAFMGRVTSAYVELPGRLLQCRSPIDVWREQARFAERIFSMTQPASRPTGKKARKHS